MTNLAMTAALTALAACGLARLPCDSEAAEKSNSLERIARAQ
jgi:hypothetical protein